MQNYNFFKDGIPLLIFGIAYKSPYDDCNVINYGKTKYFNKVIMCEHLEILVLTGKRVKGDEDSTFKENLLFCNHV